LNNKLFLIPLENPQKVLDLSTGTGIDLSPTQPSGVPPNCKFELDNTSQEEWMFPDNTFDYIHIRYLLGYFKD
ncbi:unnamed protein product, partial [Clonostachys rosea f. rosea IK726]